MTDNLTLYGIVLIKKNKAIFYIAFFVVFIYCVIMFLLIILGRKLL